MANEIIIFRTEDEAISVDVRFEAETVWLTIDSMSKLFEKSRSTINEHILNVYSEKELKEEDTLRKIGNSDFSTKPTNFYNLDVIISVGYRVKSQRGTQFRIWANKVLKEYLLRGYAINQRFEHLENRVSETEKKIEIFVKSSMPPLEGVFFDGQVFDAYELASKIIRSAKESIVLIDNYIDENTLTHLAKKKKGVKALLLTKNTSKQVNLDVQKANAQYGDFAVKQFTQSHDRFLIIDKGEAVYHIGASLKDLGKRWFAFSKMNKDSVASIVSAVGELIFHL